MQGRNTTRRQAGFTLTELLVATAIFVILMTALVTLFSAAVGSARQGYANIDVNETARAAMSTISRDLTTAYTSREHGEVLNFYGRPDSFMFVGGLDGGNIGRVSYVLHPEASSPPIATTYRARWGEVEATIRRQAERLAREGGRTGVGVATYADSIVQDVESYYFNQGTGNAYADDDLVEFEIQLVTESLIRYEEAGVGDLDTYNMTITRNGALTPVALPFPYVDAVDPGRDDSPAAWGVDGDRQLEFLWSALNPDPSTNTYDLRSMFYDINGGGGLVHPITNDVTYLRVLGPQLFDSLLRIKKREFWLRMLSGDSMNLPELSADTNPSQQNGAWGYWYDENFDAPNNRERKTLNEYVVANGIVTSAALMQPGTDIPIYAIQGNQLIPDTVVDILDASPKFSYGDGTSEPVRYFNDLENLRDPDRPDGLMPTVTASQRPTYPATHILPSLPSLLASARQSGLSGGSFAISAVDLVEADSLLADNLLGTRDSRQNLGSPLTPRAPTVVTVDFWVTRQRTRPGSPDVLKHFAQAIQLPAAKSRSIGATIALSPGGSL